MAPGLRHGGRTTRRRWLAPALAGAIAAIVVSGGAAAHEGDGRAEVIPAQVSAGESVTVVGEGLTPSSVVEVELETAGGPVALGSGMTDADGSVTIEVLVPSDVEARYYELHATDATGLALTGYLEVVPSATRAENGEGGAGGSADWTGFTWGAAAALGVAALAVPVLTALRARRMTGAARTRPPDA